jgi:hypothetical protein
VDASNTLLVWACLQCVSGDGYLTYLPWFVVAGSNSVRIIGCGLYMFLRNPHPRYCFELLDLLNGMICDMQARGAEHMAGGVENKQTVRMQRAPLYHCRRHEE